MGIDAQISLPPNVRVFDVARVIGALRGLPVRLRDMNCGTRVADVEHVCVESIPAIPQCANIYLSREQERFDRYMLHFEGPGGRRLLIRRSTPEDIALFVALAEFFGGVVDFNDHDDEADDHVVPDKSDVENCPEDGLPWQRLQERIAAVQPLTSEDAAKHASASAYGGERR